ncbi:MAG: hypothetical protein K8L91_16250 [Anaerolineae bacterium]|nr:hypothetical protein [Anaerolineae bacterium]
MTLNELTDLLPTLTAGVLAIGLILFLLALRLFRRGRRASMWQSRRQAGRRGFRLMLTAVGFLGLSAMLCVTTIVFNSLDEDEGDNTTPVADAATTESATVPTETPTATPEGTVTDEATEAATEASAVSSGGEDQMTPSPENTVTLAPSRTASATASPSATTTSTATSSPTMTDTATMTITASPTDSPTGTPTITPFPTLPINITPPVAQATHAENISMRIAAIAESLTADFQPLSPRETFEVGVRRLYFFIHFRNMNSGILWRPALFKDGAYLDGGTYLWGLQAEGESYFFFGRGSGFEAGSYEIRIYIGDEAESLATETFTIQ